MTAGTFSNNGNVSGNHGGRDAWLVKLSDGGDVEWQKCMGGTRDDIANCVQQTTDGGYIVFGHTSSLDGDLTVNNGVKGLWVVKTTSKGDIEWQKSIGGKENDLGICIEQTKDGGYIAGGWTNVTDGTGKNSSDYFVVRLSQTGEVKWQKTFGGSGEEQLRAVHQTPDGGYIIAGDSQSNDKDVVGNHGLGDVWVIKLAPEK